MNTKALALAVVLALGGTTAMAARHQAGNTMGGGMGAGARMGMGPGAGMMGYRGQMQQMSGT